MYNTAQLVRDQIAVPRVNSSLLDNIGMLCRHFDDINDMRLQAGAHFVFGSQRDETPGDGSDVAHCIVFRQKFAL